MKKLLSMFLGISSIISFSASTVNCNSSNNDNKIDLTNFKLSDFTFDQQYMQDNNELLFNIQYALEIYSKLDYFAMIMDMTASNSHIYVKEANGISFSDNDLNDTKMYKMVANGSATVNFKISKSDKYFKAINKTLKINLSVPVDKRYNIDNYDLEGVGLFSNQKSAYYFFNNFYFDFLLNTGCGIEGDKNIIINVKTKNNISFSNLDDTKKLIQTPITSDYCDMTFSIAKNDGTVKSKTGTLIYKNVEIDTVDI